MSFEKGDCIMRIDSNLEKLLNNYQEKLSEYKKIYGEYTFAKEHPEILMSEEDKTKYPDEKSQKDYLELQLWYLETRRKAAFDAVEDAKIDYLDNYGNPEELNRVYKEVMNEEPKTKPLTKREQDYVAPLFQQITGLGSLSDKLGYYLRVKNSLCYSYYSSFNKNDSYFVIATGVKEENVKEALKNFDIVIQEMKKGKISKEEIETMKKKILTNVQFALDSIYGITENCYNHYVFKEPSFEEIKKEIPKVTIKELQKLASKMHKTYTYILKEGGQHERD